MVPVEKDASARILRMNHDARSGTPAAPEIVILGMTVSGRKFRPSDWAERLCGMMSIFGEDRLLSYSPYLKPIVANGLTCVVVDARLEALDPPAFNFLMDFARDNELKMRPGRDPNVVGDQKPDLERRVPESQSDCTC